MRLLLTFLQIHPALGPKGRVQVGAAQAVDAENFDAGRRYEPDTNLDRDRLDAAMAKSPPMSVAALLELVAGELQTVTGYHVATHLERPAPVPEPEPEPVEVEKPE